jgi:hypothetical protein
MSNLAPSLTSDQVRAAMRTSTGLAVSVTQLTRWAHAGLQPPAERQGKVGTRGVDWLWEPECVPRSELIATTLRYGNGSLKEAAQVLAVKGYAPRADVLKQVIDACLLSIDHDLQSNRPFLRSGMTRRDKRTRLRESLARRNKVVPRQARDEMIPSGIAIAGLWPQGSVDPHSQAQPYHSVDSLRQAVADIDPAQLLQAYSEASQVIEQMVAWFATILTAAWPAPAPKAGSPPQGKSPELVTTFTERLPREIPLSLGDHLRLVFALPVIALHVYGPPPDTAEQYLMGSIVSMLAGLGLPTELPPPSPSGG